MASRLRSDFWVSAYLRQRAATGVVAVLRRRGSAEAGAIFIKVDRLDGTARLYAPAPPSIGEDDGDRRFTLAFEGSSLEVEDRMTRELRFDRDLWLVEVEDKGGELSI